MKTRSLVIIFLFVAAWVYADDRPTVDSLIGKQIYVEDAFAGQSFTLLKGLNGNKDYKVEWIRHGSHTPTQCLPSISGKNDIKVYLNGVRIHIDRAYGHDLKPKKPNSP